jgi:hypothetical protein
MSSLNNFDSDDEYDNEIDTDEIKRKIISTMHHLIFCDLTTGRTDQGLEPLDSVEINEFISENQDNIEIAASLMYAAYEEDGDLASLKNPPLDWFREYLDELVTTSIDEMDEDDDFREDYIDQDNEDDYEE